VTTSGTVTYRPRALRIMAIVTSVVLAGLYVAGWFALPAQIRAQVTLSQRLTLLLILALMLAALWSLAASSVRVDVDGLRIRNGFRTHRLAWSEIGAFRLRPGDPWAYALLLPVSEDSERRPLMGIQAGDGRSAERAVADLRARLEAAQQASR
jgi:hypothetical protein